MKTNVKTNFQQKTNNVGIQTQRVRKMQWEEMHAQEYRLPSPDIREWIIDSGAL